MVTKSKAIITQDGLFVDFDIIEKIDNDLMFIKDGVVCARFSLLQSSLKCLLIKESGEKIYTVVSDTNFARNNILEFIDDIMIPKNIIRKNTISGLYIPIIDNLEDDSLSSIIDTISTLENYKNTLKINIKKNNSYIKISEIDKSKLIKNK